MKLQLHKLTSYWHKLTSGSTNRKIFGAAVIVAALTTIVKTASTLKELVVAWKFGTGDSLDAFLIALVVPAFITNVVADSFNAALIPVYIKVREQQGNKAAQRLFSGTTVLGSALLLVTTTVVVATAPLYLPLIASGFSLKKLNLTIHLLYALSPIILLSGIINIWAAILNAGERFALAAFSPIITPTITIIFLLIAQSWGSFALVAGLVGGELLEIVLLGVALRRQGISLLPKWHGLDTNLHQVASQYAPKMTGAFLMCSSGIVDQSMAAMLLPGSVASLNYGNRVSALPITLITTALSAAIIPYFSKMVTLKDWAGIRNTLKHYMRLVFATTLPLTALLIIFSELIVQTLFQRGSFTAQDTQLVAQIQNCFALQIPFYVGCILIVKLVESMQFNYILVWVSMLNLLNNIVFNYLFSQWIGVKGIALSTSFVYIFSFLFLFFFIKNKLKQKIE